MDVDGYLLKPDEWADPKTQNTARLMKAISSRVEDVKKDNVDEVHLYITGLTRVIIIAVNMFCANGIDVALYEWDCRDFVYRPTLRFAKNTHKMSIGLGEVLEEER